MRLLVPKSERELGLLIRLESCHDQGVRSRTWANLSIKVDTCCLHVPSGIFHNSFWHPSALDFFAFEIVDLESDSNLRLFLSWVSLRLKESEEFYWLRTLNHHLQLRILPNGFIVDASTSCILSLAPLGLVAILNPLVVKGSAQEERLEVLEEVRHAQPVGTVLCSNLDLSTDSSLLHPLIDYAAASLSPLL